MTNIHEIKAKTQAVYDRKAKAWDHGRKISSGEEAWISELLRGVPSESAVLDLGCGTGKPLAQYAMDAGLKLTGLDSSPEMIRMAQANFPQAKWVVQNMCQWDEPDTYDIIHSWDGFFHLSPEEQRRLLPKLAEGLRAGGKLLLTIGDGEEEVIGQVHGDPVYHASLSHSEYTKLLEAAGIGSATISDYDHFDANRIVLFATKAA